MPCLARLAAPTSAELFLDPMCGGGTIALEAALGVPCKAVICGDVDPEAVAATRQNSDAAGAALGVLGWDVRALPLTDGAVDTIATNMPYGKDVTLGDPAAFIKELLRELARVLRPSGRLVLLSRHRALVRRQVARTSTFKIRDELQINIHGFDLNLFVMDRAGGRSHG